MTRRRHRREQNRPSSPSHKPILGQPRILSRAVGRAIADSNTPIPNLHPSHRSIESLVERIENQPAFTLAIAALFSLGQASRATVKHDEKNPREKKFAELMVKLWHDHLAKALLANSWGRACFEKTYLPPTDLEMIRGVRLDYLEPTKSKVWRKDGKNIGVKYREAGYKDEGKDDRKGGIANFINPSDKEEKDEVSLLSHECYFVVINQSSKYPQGKSMFIGAAQQVVAAMEELKKQKNIFTHKAAMGHGLLKAPSKYDPQPGQSGDEAAIDPQTGQPMDPLEDGQEIINELVSGGTAIVPSEPHEGTSIPKWDFTPPSGSSANAGFFLENERKLDDEAPMSIGVPPRAVSQNADVGSLAMSKTHLTVLEQRVISSIDPIRGAFQEQVIDPAAKVNFSSSKTFELQIDYVSIEQFTILLDLVKQIAMAPMMPPLVAQGVIDMRQLLQKVRVPISEDGNAMEEINKLVEAAATNASPELAPSSPSPVAEELPPQDNPATKDVEGLPTGVDQLAATALNGAQITSLLDILTQLSTGMIPAGVARGVINAAFPTLPADVVETIIGGMEQYQPPAPPLGEAPAAASMSRKGPGFDRRPSFPITKDTFGQADSIIEVTDELAEKLREKRDKLISSLLGGPQSVSREKLASVFNEMESETVKGMATARIVGVADLARRSPQPTVDDPTLPGTNSGDQVNPDPGTLKSATLPAPINLIPSE